MDKPKEKKKITFSRWAVRALAISASTISLLDLLKGEFKDGGLLALGWLAIVIAEKRMFKNVPANSDENHENAN